MKTVTEQEIREVFALVERMGGFVSVPGLQGWTDINAENFIARMNDEAGYLIRRHGIEVMANHHAWEDARDQCLGIAKSGRQCRNFVCRGIRFDEWPLCKTHLDQLDGIQRRYRAAVTANS